MATADELDLRVDPLTGEPTVIVARRQHRPNLPDGCPFCVGGLEAPHAYEVRSFPNRWPPIPGGRSEVVLYTPEHDATFWSLGTAGAHRVVDLWAERSARLGARPDVRYVLVFENRGAAVGATIHHPHGQIYAYPSVPPAVLAELGTADVEAALGVEAAGSAGERLVTSAGAWRAWVPWAAPSPYELLVAPTFDVADLPTLDAHGRSKLAALLVDVLERLDRVFGAPMPYMLWVHQRPFDGHDHAGYRLHIHIRPLLRAADTPRFIAAAEQGARVWFNPVDPVDAAAALRAAGSPPDRDGSTGRS